MNIDVDQQRFDAAYYAGAPVVDVRQPEEYASGHVPDAVLIPFPQLAVRLSEVPRGEAVYVICASGNRSKAATELLRRAGVQAFSVAGGTSAWARAGRPIVTGMNPGRRPTGAAAS